MNPIFSTFNKVYRAAKQWGKQMEGWCLHQCKERAGCGPSPEWLHYQIWFGFKVLSSNICFPNRRNFRDKDSFVPKFSSFFVSDECPLCSEFHNLSECWDFYNMSPKERDKLVQKDGSCFHCLVRGHCSKVCPTNPNVRCGFEGCDKYHHRLLHLKDDWHKIREMAEDILSDILSKVNAI